jgi:hypothetical protein
MLKGSRRCVGFVKKLTTTKTFCSQLNVAVDDLRTWNPNLEQSEFIPSGSFVTLELSPTAAAAASSSPFVKITPFDQMLTAGVPAVPGWFPPMPPFPQANRDQAFGQFAYVDAPTAKEPDGIRITGGWDKANLGTVALPELAQVRSGTSGNITFYRGAHPQIRSLFASWRKAGLLALIKTWDGAYNPRYMRKATHIRKNLSNHAWGTAFDINASLNRLGQPPAALGTPGCVFELVEIAHQHGFYWGGHFRGTRPDGMHFEVARIL